MSYTVENKQDIITESVLQITEKTFTLAKCFDYLASTSTNTQKATEVYFEIED
jgi:hypothetical protein